MPSTSNEKPLPDCEIFALGIEWEAAERLPKLEEKKALPSAKHS